LLARLEVRTDCRRCAHLCPFAGSLAPLAAAGPRIALRPLVALRPSRSGRQLSGLESLASRLRSLMSAEPSELFLMSFPVRVPSFTFLPVMSTVAVAVPPSATNSAVRTQRLRTSSASEGETCGRVLPIGQPVQYGPCSSQHG
jgi:hypothetical protein